jgi:uncharacterized protein (TIGR03435 family)
VHLLLAGLFLMQEPVFEDASVKPSVERARAVGDVRTYPGGRITIVSSTLEYLVELAFGVQRFQISGGPEWIYREGFDIEAKPANSLGRGRGTSLSEEQRRMLLSLLVERFQLACHRQSRPGPIYSLTATDYNLKLRETADRDSLPLISGPDGVIGGVNVSMALLAAKLSRWLDCPVVDRTGLSGSYDFKIANDSEELASIRGSLQRLGLKLEPGKGPVDAIVVDGAQRPTPN